MPPKRSLPLAVWVFLLALAVRLWVLMRFGASPYLVATSGDMKFYADWAMRIAGGVFTDHKAFYGLPGYPFFLGGIFFLFGFDPFLVGFLQTACEAGTAVLIFELARWAVPNGKGKAAGALAALGWTFFQPAQAFSVVLMPTSWLVLAYWGILWWVVRTRSRSGWKPWLGIGIATGLMATVIATILLVLPLPLAAAFRNLRRSRAFLAAAACLAGGVFLGAAPCWIHNYWIAGEPIFLSAHSGVNFWIGNNPRANGYPRMPPGLRASQDGMLKDSIRLAETAAGHPLTRAEVSRFWSAKAHAYIREHPGEWLSLMGTKVRNSWNAFQYDDLSLITTLREEGVLTPGLRFGVVAALAIPGMLLGLARYPRSRWVAAAVLLHFAALLPVFVTERYRLAAVPGLLLFAAIGLVEFWDLLARRREREWLPWSAAYLVAAFAGTWFVSLPQKDEALWSLDAYNTGAKALNFGQIDRAQAKLERAFAYVPNNGEINFVLGNLWLKKENPALARRFYLRAIEIDPGTLGALNNLAVLEIGEKHWPAAKTLLAAALRTEPDDAKVHYLLAYANYNAGDREIAKTEIARALALRPGQVQFQQLEDAILAERPLQPLSP